MGKASKWLKGLLGFKKPEPIQNPATKPPAKKRWSFGKSHKENGRWKSQNDDWEAGSHAAVVKLKRGDAAGMREERAAVVIQSHFRAYLSKRALQALKALVKLQALVRGQLLRKRHANKLKAIARPHTTRRPSISTAKSSPLNHMEKAMQERLDYTTPAKQEQLIMHKKNRSRSNSNLEKILEVDTWKPKHKLTFHSPHLSYTSDQYCQSYSTPFHQAAGFSPLSNNYTHFSTAENSPQYYSASSMGARAPFTPTKSDRSRSYLSCSSDSPSYMACTQSSKAKVRSLSAPKQRPQNVRMSSVKKYSFHERPNNKRASTVPDNLARKPYPGSGHLDRHRMPVRDDVSGFGGAHWYNKNQ